MRLVTLGLLLGCAGIFGGDGGEDTASADPEMDADTDTGDELDPRCKVVLPASTWVQQDWNDTAIRSNAAVWVCDSDASATVGGDNNVMVLSGNAHGSLQGGNHFIYAVGSEGYYAFVGGEGNTRGHRRRARGLRP